MTPLEQMAVAAAPGLAAGAAIGAFGKRMLIAALRPRRPDPRKRADWDGDVKCPRCKAWVLRRYEQRFCAGPEDNCFEYDGPHFHATCPSGDRCRWKGLVKP